MDKIKQVIIWGYPITKTHTQAFIHSGWYKAFSYLGYKTYWFEDEDHPIDFEYDYSLFIGEGSADNNIPINSSSVYCINFCINPEKYLNKNARVIDIRLNVDSIIDFNYHYSLKDEKEKGNVERISDISYYHKLTDNGGLKKWHHKPKNMNYEAIYTSWATDLLPHEFDYSSIDCKKENVIYYIGTLAGSNSKNVRIFAEEAKKNGIAFKISDPWKNPLSFEDCRKYMAQSIICPDIRGNGDISKISIGETGTCHKDIGYIPCRVFKAISYGCLGITNSRHVYELFDRKVIYSDDEKELFHLAMREKDNTNLIKEQMDIVKEKHTYINRVNDIITIVNKT